MNHIVIDALFMLGLAVTAGGAYMAWGLAAAMMLAGVGIMGVALRAMQLHEETDATDGTEGG